MKAFRFFGVETIAPEAQAPEGLRKVVTSCGASVGVAGM